VDFEFSDVQWDLQEESLALARRFPLEYWHEADAESKYPTAFLRAFADQGWLGLTIPESYGGAGMGMIEASIVLHSVCLSGAGTSGASPIHFYYFPPRRS
jgi:acyl-CoA dehydrogenase